MNIHAVGWKPHIVYIIFATCLSSIVAWSTFPWLFLRLSFLHWHIFDLFWRRFPLNCVRIFALYVDKKILKFCFYEKQSFREQPVFFLIRVYHFCFRRGKDGSLCFRSPASLNKRFYWTDNDASKTNRLRFFSRTTHLQGEHRIRADVCKRELQARWDEKDSL